MVPCGQKKLSIPFLAENTERRSFDSTFGVDVSSFRAIPSPLRLQSPILIGPIIVIGRRIDGRWQVRIYKYTRKAVEVEVKNVGNRVFSSR